MYIQDCSFQFPGASNHEELAELLKAEKAPFEQWKSSWCGRINDRMWQERKEALAFPEGFDRLDRVAKLAVLLAADVKSANSEALFIGSARGATQTWEEAHATSLQGNPISVRTSPLTTLGNLASNAVNMNGLPHSGLSGSMTCSSGLQSLMFGLKLMRGNVVKEFIGGGVEAPLTDFTYAQFDALGLLANAETNFPSEAMLKKRRNSLVLSEGGVLVRCSNKPSAFRVSAIAEATEKTKTPTSLARNAMETSMKGAVREAGESPDLIIAHAPGTLKGDHQELQLIREIFGQEMAVMSTKGYTGHTLGASGMVSLVFALHMLERGEIPKMTLFPELAGRKCSSVMINATGFGGNAMSLIVSKAG